MRPDVCSGDWDLSLCLHWPDFVAQTFTPLQAVGTQEIQVLHFLSLHKEGNGGKGSKGYCE